MSNSGNEHTNLISEAVNTCIPERPTGTGTGTGGDTGTGTGTPTFTELQCNCRTPQILYGNCNKKKIESAARCKIVTTRRTFFTTTGDIAGIGIVTNGMVTMEHGYQTGSYKDSESYIEFDSYVVTCPTSGNGNDCEEYKPC